MPCYYGCRPVQGKDALGPTSEKGQLGCSGDSRRSQYEGRCPYCLVSGSGSSCFLSDAIVRPRRRPLCAANQTSSRVLRTGTGKPMNMPAAHAGVERARARARALHLGWKEREGGKKNTRSPILRTISAIHLEATAAAVYVHRTCRRHRESKLRVLQCALREPDS